MSRVIGLVYDCAANPSHVSDLLRGLAGLFRSHFADMFVRRHDGSQPLGTAIGLDRADYEDGMIATWSPRNPWGRAAPVVSAGDVRATWQFLPRDALRRSEMFADYLDARDLHEGMRFEVWSGPHGIEDVSLLRSFAAGPFTPDELALGRLLMPHLQRAATLRRRLRGAELATQAGLQALETLSHGIVFVDRAGNPTFTNGAARDLLSRGDFVTVVAGEWSAGEQASSSRFAAMLRRAAQDDENARAGAVLLPSRSGEAPLTALALPLRGDRGWTQPGQPTAILCFGHRRPTIGSNALRPFATLFGLTMAETQLAGQLLEGKTVAEIAKDGERSIATVRTHLYRLMAKTGSNRQSELVKSIASFPKMPDDLGSTSCVTRRAKSRQGTTVTV